MPAGGMDNDYPIDVGEIINVVRTAEVIIFRFLIIPKRMLLDPRTDDRTGPLVQLVAPANSAEERFRSLRALRPSLKMPERITVIHWPKFTDLLVSSGVWSAVEQRLADTGHAGTGTMVTTALEALQAEQEAEVRRAITGENYQALWEG